MIFQIQTESFEGPIDVLLNMIEKRKLLISDISLSEITDDYIQFVKNLSQQKHLSQITHFIIVASVLILIKSKSILPSIDLTEEEEGNIDELKKRIQLLALYREASVSLKEQISLKRFSFYPKTRKKDISFQPAKNITKKLVYESFYSLITTVPIKENKQKEANIKITIHIEELMDSLEKRIKKGIVNFNSFIKNISHDQKHEKEIRTYQVVGFLAMLEMVKNGILHVDQKHNFEAINIAPLNNN